MKDDPLKDVRVKNARVPTRTGRGSSREAWIAYAFDLADSNNALWDLARQQSAAIVERDAEIELLRQQIAARKPPGARQRLPDQTVARIEAELHRGSSTRHIAKQFRVSAMTVSRIGRRASARTGVGVT